MNYLYFILVGILVSIGTLRAQSTISGVVLDEDGGPIIGGNIIVEGATPTIRTVTGYGGDYVIEVPEGYNSLSFSFAGFSTQNVEINERMTIDVIMIEGVALKDVVVTALGLSRKEKALGYATQGVDGEELNKAREINIVNSLQGKVSGMQITGSPNLGGSSRVIIRGIKSIMGNNQPLFVMNGVPLNNSNFTSDFQASGGGGYDYGNAIQDLNPDDIENINVLKGATAAALYGDRAANGVILITTKKGTAMSSENAPIGVNINSSLQFNEVYMLPQYQNKYGGGAGSVFPNSMVNPSQQVAETFYDGSWGPAFDNATAVRQWDSYDEWDTENYGKTRPWNAKPNNVKDFFRTGITATNSIAFGAAMAKGSFRLGFTNTQQKGTQENSSLSRNNVSLNSTLNLTDKLTAGANINIVSSNVNGRPLTGYELSVMSQFNQWFQRQLDIDRLRVYKNPDGTQRAWNRTSEIDASPKYWDNPFWERYENGETDRRDRLFGNISLSYRFDENFTLTARAMQDMYTDHRQEWIAVGGFHQAKYTEDIRTIREHNYDMILNYTEHFGEDISISAIGGLNYRTDYYDHNYIATQGGLKTPGLYNLSNSAAELLSEDFTSRFEVFSIFEQVSVGYKNYMYVDLTNRTDFNSTLPLDRNVYNYYSGNLSFVFSELLNMHDIFSFGKFRIGYARVGTGTTPYNLNKVYTTNANFGVNGASTVPDVQLNANLKPEVTSCVELGLDLRLLKDRLGIDLTYYNNVTKDEIFNLSQSATTGFTSRVLNAGKIRNRGVELIFYATPVKNKDFKWDVKFNLAKNNNKVLELYNGTDNIRLTSLFGVALEARIGEPYGTLVGTTYERDANGNYLTNQGVYIPTDTVTALGSVLADFTGGLSTTLRYKDFSLFVLLDFQKGGHLYSLSNQWGKNSGILAETAEGSIREEGIVVEGVAATQDENGMWVTDGTPNTDIISAKTHFYVNQGSFINEASVYDASFLKLRELRLTYTFPNSLLKNIPIRDLSLSLVGRNLAIIHKNIPHIDPEAAISSGNIQGFEGGQLPTERSIGVNLGVKF